MWAVLWSFQNIPSLFLLHLENHLTVCQGVKLDVCVPAACWPSRVQFKLAAPPGYLSHKLIHAFQVVFCLERGFLISTVSPDVSLRLFLQRLSDRALENRTVVGALGTLGTLP